jgi:hypothetical protein
LRRQQNRNRGQDYGVSQLRVRFGRLHLLLPCQDG